MRLKQGCRIPEVLLLLTLCSSLAVCSDSDTPWSSIVDTPEYKSLAGCAQECVYDVTIVTNCTVYSCVCSGNTNGDNFLMGWTYIDTCTTEGCQDQSAANEALLAFRDICAGDTPTSSTTSTTQTPKTTSTTIPPTLPTTENGQPGGGGSSSNPPAPTRASSSSTPTSTNTPVTTTIHLIKPPSYPRLPPCSKFTLTGCRSDPSSTEQEQDCFPTKKPPGWESYHGLAAQLNCDSAKSPAACICAKNAFSISFNALYNQSAYFCNYLPTLKDYISQDYDNLQGSLADYCADNGYTPENYFVVVKGTAQADHDSGGCLNDDPDALKPADKIALGTGLPTLFLTICGLIFQIRERGKDRDTRGRSPGGSPVRSRSSEQRLTDPVPRREVLELEEMQDARLEEGRLEER